MSSNVSRLSKEDNFSFTEALEVLDDDHLVPSDKELSSENHHAPESFDKDHSKLECIQIQNADESELSPKVIKVSGKTRVNALPDTTVTPLFKSPALPLQTPCFSSTPQQEELVLSTEEAILLAELNELNSNRKVSNSFKDAPKSAEIRAQDAMRSFRKSMVVTQKEENKSESSSESDPDTPTMPPPCHSNMAGHLFMLENMSSEFYIRKFKQRCLRKEERAERRRRKLIVKNTVPPIDEIKTMLMNSEQLSQHSHLQLIFFKTSLVDDANEVYAHVSKNIELLKCYLEHYRNDPNCDSFFGFKPKAVKELLSHSVEDEIEVSSKTME